MHALLTQKFFNDIASAMWRLKLLLLTTRRQARPPSFAAIKQGKHHNSGRGHCRTQEVASGRPSRGAARKRSMKALGAQPLCSPFQPEHECQGGAKVYGIKNPALPSATGSMTSIAPAAVSISLSRYVTIKLAAHATGLTEKAIRRKIDEGVWVEGSEYRRQVDDGRIYIDMKGYDKWVEKEVASKYAKSPCALGSSGKAPGAGRR